MLLSPIRRAGALSALVLISLAVPASAGAEPSSQITSPAATTYLFNEEGSKLSVAGTATELTEVSIRCYSGPASYRTLAAEVPVKAGAFEVEASASSLSPLCQLRAVPKGTETSGFGPGTKTSFEGPLIVSSGFFPTETFDYFAISSTLPGAMTFESASDYALESTLYSTAAHANPQFFYGEAALRAFAPIGTRTAVQVDGANAYGPWASTEVERELAFEAKEPLKLSGKPSVTVTKEFNVATRQFSIREEDPFVKCVPGTGYPPSFKEKNCTSFAPVGVTLIRTWQSGNEDHAAWLTDTWRSTDGAAHAVNARYYMEWTGGTEGDLFRFPGEAAFAQTTKGETKTLPPGAGSISVKTGVALPDAGNGEKPQGVVGYDSAPSEPILVTKGSTVAEKSAVSVFEMPYQRSVPAGGSSSTLRMVFTQSFSLTEALALAESTIAGYYPSVSIGSPANGSVTTTPAVTVTGTASDGIGLSSLTVNGKAVAVGAGGAWSTSVPLSPGSNTITATATNQSGLSRSASETVTYKPSPPPVPPPTANQVGTTSGANGQVTFTIACHGLAGTSCKVHAGLSTVEKLRHGRVVAVTSARTRSKRITVASLTLVIPAGQTVKVTLKPNATGRRLLAKFHRLPVHLTVTLETGASRSTVIAQNLTIRPKAKPHRHRH